MIRAEVTRNGFFVAISALALHNKDDVIRVPKTQVTTTNEQGDQEEYAAMRRRILGALRRASRPMRRSELCGQMAVKFPHLDRAKMTKIFGLVVSKMLKAGELFQREQGMLLSIKKWSETEVSRYSNDRLKKRRRLRDNAKLRKDKSSTWSPPHQRLA